jgi:hypothetical protein
MPPESREGPARLTHFGSTSLTQVSGKRGFAEVVAPPVEFRPLRRLGPVVYRAVSGGTDLLLVGREAGVVLDDVGMGKSEHGSILRGAVQPDASDVVAVPATGVKAVLSPSVPPHPACTASANEPRAAASN